MYKPLRVGPCERAVEAPSEAAAGGVVAPADTGQLDRCGRVRGYAQVAG